MLFRTITQPAWPYRPKIPHPGEISGLAVSVLDSAVVLLSVFGWSVIYYLRAVTEEDRLRGVDGEYAQYCAKVRRRFIPGVY